MSTQSHITVPASLLPQLEAWGQLTTKLFGELRRQAGLPPAGVPKSQAWFWTKKWQTLEKEADEDIATGRVSGPFHKVADLMASLEG